MRDDDAVSEEQLSPEEVESESHDEACTSPESSTDTTGPGDTARPRSRSPYRPPPSPPGEGGHSYQAPFLVLSQEYEPEIARVPLSANSQVDDALLLLQRRRAPNNALRFPVLTPVNPQPSGAFALVIATPAWSRDTFIVFDLSRINGAIFCWIASPHLTRASILAVAGLADQAGLEVYVPDQDLPLGPTDVCQLRSGDCVSVIPASCSHFVVSSLQDMLASDAGWDFEAPLPCIPGNFLHLLTDHGPFSVALNVLPDASLAAEVGAALGLEASSSAFQVAVPPVVNFSDSGRLGWNIAAITRDHLQEIRAGSGWIYFLDLRPILCGVAWAFATAGLVSTALIRRQCSRPEVGRPRVTVTGGRPASLDEGDSVYVLPGEVLIVAFEDPPFSRPEPISASEDRHSSPQVIQPPLRVQPIPVCRTVTPGNSKTRVMAHRP